MIFRKSALLVFGLSLVLAGCPGAKPPAAPSTASSRPAEEGPLVWHLSKSGLGFRLSNADEEGDEAASRAVAPSTPLGADDARRLAARLPALAAEPDDSKDFAMRAKSIPAPRPGKTVNEAFPPSAPAAPPVAAVPAGPLVVERHAPEGAVELAPYLSMTFSRPMVPVTSIAEIARDKLPVSLVPEPPGKWKWLGTRTLVFQPDKRFPMATEYAVEVPAGTRSLDGQALAQPVHWTFSTPPVTLKHGEPGGSSEPLDPLLFAEFDQAIDPAEMLKSVDLRGARGGSVALKLATSDEVEANATVRRLAHAAEKGRWIAFRAAEPLPVATAFTVRIKAGAPSAEGPRRTTKDQAFGFETYGPLRATYAGCHAYHRECVPLEAWSVDFTNPIDLERFDRKMIAVTPEIPGMKVAARGSTVTISGKTKGRTHYVVHLAAAIPDSHGQTLGHDADLPVEVGPAQPTLFGAERPMVVLDPQAPKKQYTVYTINEPKLRARVYAERPEDWQAYIAYTEDWQRPRKKGLPGRLVYDKVLTTKKAPDEVVGTSIDLGPALSGGFGQALVVVESTRAVPKGYERPEVDVWVQSTALGLDAVVESDEVTGWVTALADGAPIAGADVDVLGAASAKTDAQGLARVGLTSKNGTLLVARRGRDTVIAPEQYWGTPSYMRSAPSDQIRWLVYDDRGMYKPGETVHVKGFARRAAAGRGGDLDMVPGLAGAALPYVVRDPRGSDIARGSTVVDDHGGFDLSFALPANANLGRAYLQIDAGTSLGGSTFDHPFMIEEFRRPEFEVGAHVDGGPHYVGEHAVATVSATYYAGGGLPDAPVTWHVSSAQASFSPPNRSAFHFGPEPSFFWTPISPPGSAPTDEVWTSHTNAAGAHRLRVDFDALEPSYPMRISLAAQVQDVNRQTWAAQTSLLVHPASDYVGVRLARDFVRAGEDVDVALVVTDVDGKAVPGRAVSVKAARLDWEQKGATTVEKEADPQTCEVTSPAPSTADETAHCRFATKEGGAYRVTAIVTDEHGRKNQTVTEVWVMAPDTPLPRSVARDRVGLVLDKTAYDPGDTADVLVLAPFVPAEGLLTVRRQGVVHMERFRMTSRSQELKVKLEESNVPNVDIDVDLVGADERTNERGDPDPALPKRPAFASGGKSVRVLPVTRTLAVRAAPKVKAVDPGGSTTIDVDVKDPSGHGVGDAEVSVVVADEAVLALSSYETPDPISVFYASRPPGARTVRMRGTVLLGDPSLETRSVQSPAAKRGGFAFGRAEIEDDAAFAPLAAASAAPEGAPPPPPAPPPRVQKAAEQSVSAATTAIQVRTDFSALALFLPRVRTDAAGHASVPLKLPDNLTRYRVMAVAAAGDRMFGSTESTITARLPVMARPSAPRFLNFGDRFELPVVVQNQTDAPLDVGVVVRASNAAIDGPAAKRVKVPANDRVEVRFDAATVKAGTARFQIGVAAGSFADAAEVSLPVYTPATTEAFATYGVVDEGAIAQPVVAPPNVFPQFGGLEITTSSTQLQALTDAVVYLVKYPYECNEQLASRVITIAALRDVLAAFHASGLPPASELLASMKGDFQKLQQRQHPDGGWGFWTESPWPFLTVHVTHALVRAKQKGFAPNEEMLRLAKSYLRAIETKFPPWYEPEWRRVITAYALYVRNLMGDADPARARQLIAESGGVEKMPIEALGWLWPTISADKASSAENEEIRRFVANRVTETAGSAHFVTGYRDGEWVLLASDRRADGVLLDALIGDQPQSTLIPKLVKGLLDHRKAGRWINTQENAFALLALDRYFGTYEKATPDFVARAWLGDRYAGEHAFKGRTTERSEIDVPMSWLASTLKGKGDLVLAKDGPGRLYYRIGMQYAPTDLKLPPADHGFVVSREYEGADDPADVKRDPDGTWRVKAGARVRIRVSMVAPSRRYHVALVDPLPAGLEPLNPALAVTGELPRDPKASAAGRYDFWSQTWYEHQDMRDDRVEAFASLLWDGVWTYTYVARATTPGVFVVPPPKAEEMYAPETFGRGASDRMIVE